MEAALDFCDALEWPGRRIYILGTLRELGEKSAAAHADLGRRLANCKAGMLFLYGDEIAVSAEVLAEKKIPFFYSQDKAKLSSAIANFLREGDLVLLKGSRTLEMETLTEMILGEANVS